MNYLKVLGASGSKTKFSGTTCFQVFKDILVDAGNILNILGNDANNINHIFLTHSHSDHILDLPFLIDNFFEKRKTPLTIYASKETINSLKEHTFNDKIWPNFSKIKLLNSENFTLVFKEIVEDEKIKLGNITITAISANHIDGAFGYIVEKENENAYLISGDTYKNPKLWEYINNNPKIKSLVIECSFPSSMAQLAKDSKHLTPKLLAEEIEENLKRDDDLQIFVYHLKKSYYEQLEKELNDYKIFKNGGKILRDEDVIHINTGQIETNTISDEKFNKILAVNLELSSELDKEKLFEMILSLTRELTHCEAGTLYIVSKDKKYLDFKVVQNEPLNIFMSGTKGEITWNSLPLYLEDGSENKTMVAVVSALENKIVNISNIYENKSYNFEGTKAFDANTGYKSQTMLVIPLINHEQDVIGVLQLLNKTKVMNSVIPFTLDDEKIIKAFAAQAAMALTNSLLINSLEEFLNAFVTTIAHAIDAKSKHTSKHIDKVAKIANLIAKSIDKDKSLYKDINYNENDFKEIELAAYMHDIGKISMPEHIIDKATKLEAFIDRIEIIKQRFEIVKRDLEISLLKKEIHKNFYEKTLLKIEEDIKLLEEANIGSEFMDDEKIEKINQISKYTYKIDNKELPFLNEDEIKNLCIRKGTLTNEEKQIMNSHANLSFDMLSSLPFPKKYSNVLNIAANHHEKLNGRGYPRGLKEEQIALEDRIMILADIFEALTANDRPYKKGKKLSEVFKILSFMAKDFEIDKELLKFFFESDALKEYSKEFLKEYQVDDAKLLF